jgi:hypothetical protein
VSLPVDRASCCRIPRSSLGELGSLRAQDDVTVALDGELAWIHFRQGNRAALERLLVVRESELYTRGEDGLWRRVGERLPCFEVKEGGRALRELLPLPPVVVMPAGQGLTGKVTPRLASSDEPRATTAMLCSLEALARWAETAPASEIAALRSARAGSLVLVLGAPPPAVTGSERFWGERILVPLGRRLEPELHEEELRAAAGAAPGDMILARETGFELVPESVLAPLSRASVRLAEDEA